MTEVGRRLWKASVGGPGLGRSGMGARCPPTLPLLGRQQWGWLEASAHLDVLAVPPLEGCKQLEALAVRRYIHAEVAAWVGCLVGVHACTRQAHRITPAPALPHISVDATSQVCTPAGSQCPAPADPHPPRPRAGSDNRRFMPAGVAFKTEGGTTAGGGGGGGGAHPHRTPSRAAHRRRGT